MTPLLTSAGESYPPRFIERMFGFGYTSMVGVATNTGNMRAARIGATPSVRAARHSGVDE